MKKIACTFLIVLGIGVGVVEISNAEEVPEGYILSKENLSKAKNQTFEGHNLADMLTEGMLKLFDNGFKMQLAHTKKLDYILPDLKAASAKYSGSVKYDPATNKISGYVAGTPFPNFSESDPYLAQKLVWNHYYSFASITDISLASAVQYIIDGKKGVERNTALVNTFLKMTHRTLEPAAPKMVGDGSVYQKLLLFNIAPQDIAGTGAYVQRYDDGRVDDSWAYIKAIRRIRRASGGTWMNPVPGSLFTNDENGCFSAHPTWYPKYEYKGKKWILAVMNSKQSSTDDPLAMVDTKNPPYWNHLQVWEPREVYVVDTIMPPEHSAGMRRGFYNTEVNGFVECEIYDKKGEFWKFFQVPLSVGLMMDGQYGVASNYIFVADFQRMAAVYLISFRHANDIRMNPDMWAAESLADSQKFSIGSLKKNFGEVDWVDLMTPGEKAKRLAIRGTKEYR